jgi:hypothetical protein
LLISLIGAGASPAAFAHAYTAVPTVLGALACDEADMAALPACSEGVDKDWTLQAAALEPGPSLLVRRSVSNEDWAPGEVVVANDAIASTEMPSPLAGPEPVQGLPANPPSFRAKIPPPPVRPEPVEGLPATPPGFRTATLPPPARPERVEGLSANHSSIPAGLVEPTTHPASARAAQVSGPSVPPTPATFPEATHATRVLDDLVAVRSRRRDEFPRFPHLEPLPRTTSASDRVLATLQDIVAPPLTKASLIEDGPTKRLRKLAVLAEKAQAQAAAVALAAGVVDLPLPLVSPPNPPPAASPFGDQKVAVAATSLDRVRGGFSGDGLNISFGIERAVYINGALVTTTTLNVTDLGQAVAGRAVTTLDAGAIALIQNGIGNRIAAGSITSSSTAGTIVQNTLDGQKIQNITTINATANSLGIFQNLNLGASLRGAVIDSLRR